MPESGEYRDVVEGFNLLRHLDEDIDLSQQGLEVVEGRIHYRVQLEGLEKILEQFGGSPTDTHARLKLYHLCYAGLSEFEPLRAFIRRNKPSQIRVIDNDIMQNVMRIFAIMIVDKFYNGTMDT